MFHPAGPVPDVWIICESVSTDVANHLLPVVDVFEPILDALQLVEQPALSDDLLSELALGKMKLMDTPEFTRNSENGQSISFVTVVICC